MNKKNAPIDKLAETTKDELKLDILIHSGLAGVTAAAIFEISTRAQFTLCNYLPIPSWFPLTRLRGMG